MKNKMSKIIYNINMKESKVIVCKCCNHNKTFGVRIDKIDVNSWEFAWAFPLKNGAEKREKEFINNSESIKGNFTTNDNYPGCPYCGNKYLFICGNCGGMSCYDGISLDVPCNFCNSEVDLRDSGPIESIDKTTKF